MMGMSPAQMTAPSPATLSATSPADSFGVGVNGLPMSAKGHKPKGKAGSLSLDIEGGSVESVELTPTTASAKRKVSKKAAKQSAAKGKGGGKGGKMATNGQPSTPPGSVFSAPVPVTPQQYGQQGDNSYATPAQQSNHGAQSVHQSPQDEQQQQMGNYHETSQYETPQTQISQQPSQPPNHDGSQPAPSDQQQQHQQQQHQQELASQQNQYQAQMLSQSQDSLQQFNHAHNGMMAHPDDPNSHTMDEDFIKALGSYTADNSGAPPMSAGVNFDDAFDFDVSSPS